jgi:L-serine dehydratase
MPISILDLYKIGIGPSSSHTVGPMRAAFQFAHALRANDLLPATNSIVVELFGSLGATGKGHGSDKAILLGLEGEKPDEIEPATIDARLEKIRFSAQVNVLGVHPIAFRQARHLLFRDDALPYHSNGMRFTAYDAHKDILRAQVYYSIGGGFVIDENAARANSMPIAPRALPLPFQSGDELLALCRQHHLSISQVMLRNESAWRPEAETRAALLNLWRVMQDCVRRGCENKGILPGGLRVRRRAPALYRKLTERPEAALADPLNVMDWVNLYAIAVNEENAAGGRVVTAPTNGAAGIIPAVMHYWTRFHHGATDDSIARFLLTAGAIGILFKKNASISGADVGCQGEVGVACSMAAAGLAEARGGSPAQVENAAEIGMEHNLGLTCDPINGLVQVPCIERNAMGAVKAINAARLALRGDGEHFVSLDKVIRAMRDTGQDMHTKYKETARGGLAVHVIEC